MKEIANLMLKASEATVSFNPNKLMIEALNTIREAEDRLRKDGKLKVYIVGGHHPLIRDNWLPQMSESIGIDFIMIGHKLSSKRAVGFIPECTEMVILMKDMASHALRIWSKKEAQRLNIPMIETTQKVLNAVEDIKNWSSRIFDIGQELKSKKALELQQALERGEEVSAPTKTNGNYLYYDTFKSLVDNNIYSYFPFHSTNEKDNRDFWFDKIRTNLADNYTYYTDELEEYMDKYLAEIRKKCPLQLKSKWVYSYFDDKTLDPENLKNSSRVNNSFKVIFNSRLPDELRKEVADLLHLIHGEDQPIISVVSHVEEVVEAPIETVIETPKPIEEASKPIEEAPKPIETPKPIEETPKPIETSKDQGERTVVFTDLSLTLKRGSQILLKQVKANKIDLTQSQDLDISIDKVEDGILYNVLIKY